MPKPRSTGGAGRGPHINRSDDQHSLLWRIARKFVGKNMASWARSLTTLIGGALIGWGFLQASQVDDGLTVAETFSFITGGAAIWISRFRNYLRAKKLAGRSLDKVGEVLGPILGRSVHSAVRAGITALGGFLAAQGVVTAQQGESLGTAELSEVLTGVGLWLFARIYSYYQEGPPPEGTPQ